jgi:hypothetical protein
MSVLTTIRFLLAGLVLATFASCSHRKTDGYDVLDLVQTNAASVENLAACRALGLTAEGVTRHARMRSGEAVVVRSYANANTSIVMTTLGSLTSRVELIIRIQVDVTKLDARGANVMSGLVSRFSSPQQVAKAHNIMPSSSKTNSIGNHVLLFDEAFVFWTTYEFGPDGRLRNICREARESGALAH